MSLDLEAERDLTLIFERDDIHDAFAGHCCKTHRDVDSVKRCEYCTRLRVILANAITEWLALVDQDRAARRGADGSPRP